MASDARHEPARLLISSHPAYSPARTISQREIFREMIAEEVRRGRLDRARRQRIVRYAAQLGLSPVEAGAMIQDCRAEALQSDDPSVREYALRLIEPPPAWSFRAKLGVTVLGAILFHLALRIMF